MAKNIPDKLLIVFFNTSKFFASGVVEDRSELDIQEKIGATSSGNICKGKYRDKAVCIYQYSVQNRHILNQYGKIGYNLISNFFNNFP